MMTPPRLYLGTMTFGWTKQTSSVVDLPVAKQMLETFVKHNHQQSDANFCYVDTARIYAGGQTEVILGHALLSQKESGRKIRIGTKAHPSQTGGLSRDGILAQYEASLSAMGDAVQIDEYYLHQPDPDHDLLESLTTLNELCEQARSKQLV